MRTTVTLDRDVQILIEKTMQERAETFKQVLNDAIRVGLNQGKPVDEVPSTPTFHMGWNRDMDLEKSSQVVAEGPEKSTSALPRNPSILRRF